MQRPDLLALLRVSSLKEEQHYPAIWQWGDAGTFRNGPEDLLGIEDWNAMAWFVPQCREMARRELAPGLVTTPVDEVIVAMCRLGAELEGDSFGYPGAGRPSWQFSNAVVLTLHTRNMRERAESENRPVWLTDAFGLEFTRARLTNTVADVQSAVDWWFNPNSIGWTGEQEYINALSTIDGLIGDATRATLLTDWRFWDGEEEEFDALWHDLVVGMNGIREDLESRVLPENHTPFSYAPYYPAMFERLGISGEFTDFFDEAQGRWYLLNEEANRLAQIAGHETWQDFIHNYDFSDPEGPQLIESDEALEAAYTSACAETEQLFRRAGALSVNWGNYHSMNVSLLDPSQAHHTPTAMVMTGDRSDDPNRPVHVMMQVGGWEALEVEEEATERQRHQSFMYRLTAAHELTHVWTNWLQAGRVPVTWSSPSVTGIGIEGAAFAAEMLWLEYLENPSIADGIIMLQHRLQRLGRVIVEHLYHNMGVPFDEIVPMYARFSGLSLEDARREARRMTVTPLQFSSYVLGSWAIEAAAELSFDGNLTSCWRGFMEDTAACMFPSWWLQATERVDDRRNVPWIPQRCYPLMLTQRLFPREE